MPKRLAVIKSDSTNPYKNLALESWLLEHVTDDQVILYLWQNQNTVVIGKNQNAWKECHITTLEADGGHLARRLSGGGAVYHDLGNVNFTFLAQKAHYDVTKQLDVILRALKSLGIEAEKSGRNDVLVGGRKVSGNAFYEHKGHCYHHGTLLLDVDGEKMARYLNVSKAKLASKGVDSVRARVTNLGDVCPGLDVETLMRALCNAFADVYGGTPEEIALTSVDAEEWARLTEHYSSWEWKYGRRFQFDRSFGQRFSWGSVDVALAVDGGSVKDAQVYSDALVPDFIDALPQVLIGKRYEACALAEAVRSAEVQDEHVSRMKNELADWMMTLDY